MRCTGLEICIIMIIMMLICSRIRQFFFVLVVFLNFPVFFSGFFSGGEVIFLRSGRNLGYAQDKIG